jgi:hypothetical protein
MSFVGFCLPATKGEDSEAGMRVLLLPLADSSGDGREMAGDFLRGF